MTVKAAEGALAGSEAAEEGIRWLATMGRCPVTIKTESVDGSDARANARRILETRSFAQSYPWRKQRLHTSRPGRSSRVGAEEHGRSCRREAHDREKGKSKRFLRESMLSEADKRLKGMNCFLEVRSVDARSKHPRMNEAFSPLQS